MSQKSHNKQKYAKRYTKHIVARHAVTVLSLIALLIVGLVSTTFASFVSQPTANEGSLIADIQTAVVNRDAKEYLADTKANVDVADTGYNVTGGMVVYYDDTYSQISSASGVGALRFMVGHGSYSRGTLGTKIQNTNLYYFKISESWGDATQFAVFGVSDSSGWGGENNSIGNRRQYAIASTDSYNMSGNFSGTFIFYTTPEATKTLTPVWQVSNTSGSAMYNSVDKPQRAYVYAASAGSSTYSASTTAGTVKVSGYHMTGTSATSANSAVSTLGSTDNASVDLARSSTVTLTATPADGYEFVGWYTSASGGSAVSTNLTYTYMQTGADSTDHYARFKEKVNPFAAGDTIYFDARSSTTWSNNTIYVQCNSNTTSGGNRYAMTKIGTYLYKYTFTATSAAHSGNVRIWSGSNYSKIISKDTYTTYNGVYVSATGSDVGTLAKFTIGTVNTPTLTLDDNDIALGTSATLTCSTPVLNYTRGSTSYTTTPTDVTYVFKQGTTTLSSSSSESYSWKPTACGTYSLTVQIGSTTAGKSSSASSAVTLTVRPVDPTALTLIALNSVAGTGTSADPYIAFEGNSFKINANATVASTAVAHYSQTSNGTYSTTNQFGANEDNEGIKQSLSVFAKAYSGNVYSSGSKNASVYYIIFSHLDGDNTGFILSDNDITDIESVTLSGAFLDGVDDAEKDPNNGYITQTYQVSTNNSTFTDLSSDTSYTWTPDAIGTYYFRVKTTNNKTGETVYSTSQTVEVKQSTVYYDITVTNDNTTYNGTVTLKTDGTTIINGQILSNSPLELSIKRPNNTLYFQYIKVDGETIYTNYSGDLTDAKIIDHVKGNVTINYKLAVKPKVTVSKHANAASISFKYLLDGKETNVTSAGEYYVDYGKKITYSVTPKTGYYVASFTGVTGSASASTATGTKNSVIGNLSVTATVNPNKNFKVNCTSDLVGKASISVDGVAKEFNTTISLNYGAQTPVVITPPDGYYAVVTSSTGVDNLEVDTDGRAKFTVTLTTQNKTYSVDFVKNPKIFMEQPKYGSIYITDDQGNYYFNGDYVGYGTELTVHVKPDHANALIEDIFVNDVSIGKTDGSKFEIFEDSTATAKITIKNGHEFTDSTEYGTCRIFFTDNSSWGDGQVMVHYSNNNNDTNFTDGHTVEMEYKFTNDASQRVYYADIPYSAKYVNFYKKSATSNYTASVQITNDANGFWHNGGNAPYAINTWQENYSDYIAIDRDSTIQQAKTLKNETVEFKYTCDFGDAALSAEVVAGNAITYDFDKGTLYITPTDNTHSFSLVKVKSSASTSVKYYLIKVDNFELISFSGIQKIYSTAVENKLQFDLIVKGGALDYTSKFFVSDTNKTGSFNSVDGNKESGFTFMQGIGAYINSFLIEYSHHSISGVKYYMVEAKDGGDRVATAYEKTLFGTNSNTGERCMYFYNATGENLDNYNIRACFIDSSQNRTFVTMQRVGETDYYRAAIPYDRTYIVNFYICYKETFSNSWDDYNTASPNEIYAFKVIDRHVPSDENIVYMADSLGNGTISGEFTEFDY